MRIEFKRLNKINNTYLLQIIGEDVYTCTNVSEL